MGAIILIPISQARVRAGAGRQASELMRLEMSTKGIKTQDMGCEYDFAGFISTS